MATTPSKAQGHSEEEGAEESSEEDYDWVDDEYLEAKCGALARYLGTQVERNGTENMPLTALAMLEEAWSLEQMVGEDDDEPERWQRLRVLAEVAGYDWASVAGTDTPALEVARDIIEFARVLLRRKAGERKGVSSLEEGGAEQGTASPSTRQREEEGIA